MKRMLLSFAFCKFLTKNPIHYVISASWNFWEMVGCRIYFLAFFLKKSLQRTAKDTATGLIVTKGKFDAFLGQKKWEKSRFFSRFYFVRKAL